LGGASGVKHVLEIERREGEMAAREQMAAYVANRRKSHEALAKLDPEANYTSDAKRLLEKALQDQAEFEARFGTG
jgi:hypothetical protein